MVGLLACTAGRSALSGRLDVTLPLLWDNAEEAEQEAIVVPPTEVEQFIVMLRSYLRLQSRTTIVVLLERASLVNTG